MFLTSELKNYKIHASDGVMGKVKDLYFDDNKWAIRYAVVDTRKWLPGRRVLMSPASFRALNEREKHVEVKHDKEVIRNSPTIPEENAVTKDDENSLISYYGWARYWAGSMIWGVVDQPMTFPRSTNDSSDNYENHVSDWQTYNLRSEDETIGFKVHANDGKIGHIADLIVDTNYWKVSYVIVQNSEKFTEEAYFIFPIEKIQQVDWFEKDMYLNTSLSDVKLKKEYYTKTSILESFEIIQN
ncbi:PRC-barrel domain-containing protein [Virgibacillus sp. AGTR]|uniref:PRC-barrel domain containing protein n=1 Tax=Virgibacillus salarius TaxID=447199 RepID=A0A941IAW2_9BACI|nr:MULTISPECIES: PRC-barrel domain-containing protein [Virgibacillus]MBR7794685.1 PRC-barrel domain containing protein [Virgibacillus salarius]MCC2248369.1 PRC-barrel domain-containing protein [Virgibacillus sp. AGTR]MDY7045228.1 PRC-barrel domain-containing protein [Virgibacillus sp. M23]QRZ16415.1 PRC-barrel domain containing protein [Virgibacillus sp. AGTR]